MKKRLFSLSAFMLLTSLSYAQFSGSGSGTESDPYLITNADELFEVRNVLNGSYKLMRNIDLKDWIEEENPREGWNPINDFTGVFDGNGKTIKGLYINRPSAGIGLFGTTNHATIKNLIIKGAIITSENTYVGALIGSAHSTNLSDITIISPKISSKGTTGSIAGSFSGSVTGNNRVDYPEINCTGNDVGGAFGSTSASIENMVLIAPVVMGGDHVGGAVGKSTNDIRGVTIISPTINGYQHIGGLIGNWDTSVENDKRYLDSNIIIGGSIKGGNNGISYVGGLVGYAYKRYYPKERYSYIVRNYCSSFIVSTSYAGGICGYISGTTWTPKYSNITTYFYQIPEVEYNRYDGEIKGNVVGGIIGYAFTEVDGALNHSHSHSGIYKQNVVTGNFDGESTCGIMGYSSASGGTYSGNIVGLDLLTAAKSIARIGGSSGTNNYASLSMTMILDGKEYFVNDGGTNGTGYSLRMLKRKNTYIGFGYDFEKDWAIVEGETLPYNINQSTPPTISSCVCGVNAKISGTASGNGTVYVFVNDKMIEGSVVNGKWQVDLGDVAEGTKVRVSVETEGKKPSIVISTKAEYTGVDVVLDENSTEVPATASNVDVQVLRTIKADEWSTICLPFTATGEQVKQAWGEDVQLASFTGWESEEDENGAIVAINVMFSSANPADGIPSNTPMLIKVSKAAETATFDGVTIEPEEEPMVQVGKKASERGRFYGTYKKTIVPEENMFLSGNKFWYSTGKTTIKGYRGYFEFRDVLDAYYDGSEVKVYMFFDEDATGISKSFPSGENLGEAYNLAGQRVAGNYKGIVIENGKKILK